VNRGERFQITPPVGDDETRWLKDLWVAEWGGDRMVSRGHEYQLSELESLIARVGEKFVGAATYRLTEDLSCELMSINSMDRGHGTGSQLLAAVEQEARAAGCRRVWLITSNDNLDALRFYQRRGYRITGIHSGAIDQARRIKPSIPLVGDHGIEIHDEIELAKSFHETDKTTLGGNNVNHSFYGIDHVQLAAPQGCEDEARRFFGDILGMEEIEKPESLRGRGGVWFRCGTQQLHIGVEGNFSAAKKAHPAFHVHNLVSLKERVMGQGISVREDELLPGAERFYLDDPFGNRLEFLEWKD